MSHKPDRASARRTVSALLSLVLLAVVCQAPGASAASSSDWPTYVADTGRSGFNGSENVLTASTVGRLKQLWTASGAGAISGQPVESGGTVFWGSWNGDEHAATLSGARLWDTFIGTSTHTHCNPKSAGVAGTAAVGLAGSTNAVFVGGGDARVYALDAATGKILWSTARLGPANEAFLYSSPLLYGGSVYIGVASLGDCPLVQGKLVKLNAATGAVQATLNLVANGCLGAGIWGSASADSAGNLYVATGTWKTCSTPEKYAAALLKIRTSDLSVLSSWQLPGREIATKDIEFGSAPTLLDFSSGATTYHYVGIGAKDGVYYVFNTASISAGPVWSKQIDTGGTCPQCGQGVLAPSAFDGTTIYAAAGKTTIGTTSCAGSVRALNPLNGTYRWQHCLSAPVLGPVTAIHGVVIAAGGNAITAVDAATGTTLYQFTDPIAGALFYGGTSVARAMVLAGNMDGHLYALGL